MQSVKTVGRCSSGDCPSISKETDQAHNANPSSQQLPLLELQKSGNDIKAIH